MSHNETVRNEFTRQADTFRASATLNADELTTRVGDALGPGVDRVLDLACGPGVLLPALLDRARSVVGVDLTPRNLQLARGAGDERLHLARALAEQIPFAARSFDAIVLRLALHHFVRPQTVLAQLRSLLRPAGRLVVLDVLGPEDTRTAELRDVLERLRDPSHTALLSASAIADGLRQAGFALCNERLWSQPRQFSEWARIINEPRRMGDLEIVLRALLRGGGDPAGLQLREQDGQLWFTYDWGLFVAEAGE